jgi:hypothetical protein
VGFYGNFYICGYFWCFYIYFDLISLESLRSLRLIVSSWFLEDYKIYFLLNELDNSIRSDDFYFKC